MIQRSESPEHDIGQLMDDHELIDLAIERAHVSTILRHRQSGLPMAIWRDGQVCIVPADEVRLPGEE